MPRRWLVAVVAALAAAPALRAQNRTDARWLSHCREEDDGLARHCEVRVTALRPGGTLTVDPGENGAVALVGWDRDSVEVHARIQTHARTEDDATTLARAVQVVTSGASIGVRGPPTDHRASWHVSFVVYAPQHSDASVTTDNGPIAVRNLRGRMQLTTRNGPTSLDDVGGEVRARTTNGPLDVTLAGDHWDGAGLDAETENDPVTLAIPEQYSARLEFGTTNGPMTIDFPLTLQGRLGRHIATTLGAGGALVRAATTNGPVEISRN